MNGQLPEFVGLMFRFRHGAFFTCIVPKTEAKRVIQAWQAGSYKQAPIVGSHNIRTINLFSQYNTSWAANMDEVVVLHEVEVDQYGNIIGGTQQAPQRQQGQNLSGP